MNSPLLLTKVSFRPLLYSFYNTFFSFYSFGSCSSHLFSFSLLYKLFGKAKKLSVEETNLFMDENLEERRVCHRPPVPMAAPWLVTHKEGGWAEHFFYNLCERPYNKIRKGFIPEMTDSLFYYFQSPSNQGWLIVYCALCENPESCGFKYGDCFLWNPVSLEKIWLPCLRSWITYPEGCMYVVDCVLSAPPTTGDDGCVVFFCFNMHQIGKPIKSSIVFCRPGDKQWRSQRLPAQLFPNAIACFKGKLHVLCDQNIQLVIEKQLSGSDAKMSLSITILKFSGAEVTPALRINRDINILESRDQLFVVVVDYHHLIKERRYEEITSFQVFRMNISLMVMEKVKSLGDHVLFLGKVTKASCSAADLGLIRGHVYFTMPEDKAVCVFDPEDGTISFDMGFSDSMKRCFMAEWLAMPPRYTQGNCRVDTDETVIVKAEPNIKTSLAAGHDKKECSKKNEGGTEIVKSGTWGSLHMDIIELIASYLHTVDCLHFRAVCKTHRLVAPKVRKRTTLEISQTTSLSPWLILHQNNNDCVYRFINPLHNDETYLINLSEYLLDATIHCSKGGWLLMSTSCKRNLLFFFNPFTRDVIRLPELVEDMCNFEGISFSSVPTSPDCIVFAVLISHSNWVFTSFISRGDDVWSIDSHDQNTKVSTFKGEYLRFYLGPTNPIFHDGRFYCLGTCGALGVSSQHNSEHSWKVLDELVPAYTSYRQSFLVECEGQLLSVFVVPLNKTRPVQIFKLHSSKETERMAWVEVRDLGKYMLFVSHTSCIAAVAPVSRMKNKIYFPRVHNKRIVFFSLDTCRYQTLFLTASRYYSSSSSFDGNKKHLYCTWIEPNWSGTTATDLVWL